MADTCATRLEIIEVGGPSFDDPPISVAQFEFWRELACAEVGDCFGDQTSQAHTLLTLHYLTVAYGIDGGESAGPAISRKIKDVQESYAAGFSQRVPLDSTKWGRMYQLLSDGVRVWPTVVKPDYGGGCGVC